MKKNKLRNILLTILFILLSLTVNIIAIPILLAIFLIKSISYLRKFSFSNKKLVINENKV